MPNITLDLEWHLHLNTPELRLVLKALGGRLKPEDLESANELGDKLTVIRADATKQMVKSAEQNIANVQKKTGKAVTVEDLEL